MWRDGTNQNYKHFRFALRVCMRALGLNNDWKKEIRYEDLGTKVDALRDLCNGMAMRAMKKSKVVAFHEFLQKKQ